MKSIEKTKKILGYTLLAPAVFSVLLFFVDFVVGLIYGESLLTIAFYKYTSALAWTGRYSSDGGGFTSALPFYFGLMAIAGAILLSNVKKPDK